MSSLSKMLGLDVDIPQMTLRAIEHLVPYHRNARTHSPAQLEQLQASLLEFGWTNAVLADDMGIVAGHGRVMAAQDLYKRGEQIRFPNGAPIPVGMVPVIDCTGWSSAQRKAYILADNRIAMNAGWDTELLSLELKELEAAEFNLELTGFDDAELAELLAGELEVPEDKDPDAVPPERDAPVSVPGDVWLCGAHRVMCGSSLDMDDLGRLMQGELTDVVWTDPPYGVDLDRKNRLMDAAVGGKRAATGAIANDKMSDAEFQQFMADAYAGMFSVMKPGATIYVAHSDKFGGVFRYEFEKAGFHYSQVLIWRKSQHVLGFARHLPNHEPILFGWKPGSKSRWYGGRTQKTVVEIGEGRLIQRAEDGRWVIKVGDQVLVVDGQAKIEEAPGTVFCEPKPAVSGLHASQKPVALIERQLKNSARPGDIVFDGFGGSGSTLVAADRLGMCARIMELKPEFTDTIVQRWQSLTGRRAVHARTGEMFPGDGEGRASITEHPVDREDDSDLF